MIFNFNKILKFFFLPLLFFYLFPLKLFAQTTGAGGSQTGGGKSAQVDEFTGAMSYGVEISVPPARGNIQPSINLNYNSYRRNPNSWVGYGWELDMGSIIRLPERGQIDYEHGKSFEVRFGGQAEAVVCDENPVSPNDYGVSSFIPSGTALIHCHAKIESAFNEYFLLSAPHDLKWIVFDKSGNRYEFGWHNRSREQSIYYGPIQVFRWMLDKVVDPNGNTLEITYGYDNLPDQINYVGQGITIDFVKQPSVIAHKVYYPVYRQTFLDPAQLGSRLQEIVVHEGSNRLMKYVLNYGPADYMGADLLMGVTPYGKTDSETLPRTALEYYQGASPHFSSFIEPFTSPAYYNHNPGYPGERLQLVDMNGDGLPDKLYAFENSWNFEIFYNVGRSFNPISRVFSDPFEHSECRREDCQGKLLGDIHEDHQFLFLQDMNGDGLVDRVAGIRDSNHHAHFLIAFNRGGFFDSNLVRWEDPNTTGPNPGETGPDEGLIDMNGDALPDRIVGHSHPLDPNGGTFTVYFNNGHGFDSQGSIWADPVKIADQTIWRNQRTPFSSAQGKIQAGDSRRGEYYAFIRDMNGDGLPDRVWAAGFTGTNHRPPNNRGILVALNLNGKQWAQPELSSPPPPPLVGGRSPPPFPHLLYNGIDVLGIITPTGKGGMLTNTTDWIDMNHDGYLDYVEGDPDRGEFRVYFFQGMRWRQNVAELSAPVILQDPLRYGQAFNNANWDDAKGKLRAFWEDKSIALFQDMNADGYPDRVALSRTNEDTPERGNQLYIYPFEIDSLNFSQGEPPVNRNQPTYALKRISSVYASSTELLSDNFIEYVPSSTSLNYEQHISPHRFLPFNLYVPKHVYQLNSQLSPHHTISWDDTGHYRGYQKTSYTFRGGNFYIHDVDGEHLAMFNGFQQVEKVQSRGLNQELKTITYYHQALGDVPLPGVGDLSAYRHFAFSGRTYKQEIIENAKSAVLETSTWVVNSSSPPDDYHCNGLCYPRLNTERKQVWELSQVGGVRISQVQFGYDTVGNVISRVDSDGGGNEILTQVTQYYRGGSFADAPLVRDRPSDQYQGKGGVAYRHKYFEYDSRGNPTLERFFTNSTPPYLQIERGFNPNGTLQWIRDMDGTRKDFIYDSAYQIFPVTETLSAGAFQLATQRLYNRLNGKVSLEIGPNQVGKEIIYDDFGRPKEEKIISASGQRQTTKAYTYEYLSSPINNWGSLGMLKVSVFQPQPGYPDTSTHPASISYADGNGATLQQCSYTERGNYRRIISRTSNGGREEVQTVPQFDQSCSFQPAFPAGVATYTTRKDLFGRVLEKLYPPGDALSPVGSEAYVYQTDNGLLHKTLKSPGNRTEEEYYDATERLVQRTDAQGSLISYEYNPVGDLRYIKQSGTPAVLTEIQYDNLGRKKRMIDANLGTWVYHYNALNQMNLQLDNKGQRIEISYDPLGRIREKRYRTPQGILEKKENYFYDQGDNAHDVRIGELYKVEETDALGHLARSTLYGYDPEYRRMQTITRSIPGLASFDQRITHDYLGRVTSTIYPGGESVFYQYNRSGGVEKMCSRADCDGTQGEVYYSINSTNAYDEFGALLQETYGNGVESHYVYYPNSRRLQQKYISKPGQAQTQTQTYSNRGYTYDERSNLMGIGDGVASTGPTSGGISTMGYDTLDRLGTYTPAGQTTAIGFRYDPKGNMLQNSASFGAQTYQYLNPSHPHAVTHIGTKQYQYDANGNMTSDPDRQRMVYNAQNQLVRVEMKNGVVAEYDYDYTGARVSKKVTRLDPYGITSQGTTHYLGEVLEIRGSRLFLNLYAKDQRIASKGLGSIQQLLGPAGATLRDSGIDPETSPSTVVPYLLILFTLLMIASFRPFPKSPPLKVRGGWGALCFNRYKRIVLFWDFYVHSCIQTLNQLHLHTFAKTICFILIFISTTQIPMIAMATGNEGLAPPYANDENFLYYIHGDHLGSSHILTEGKVDSRHAGITYKKGDLLQRFEYTAFGQEKFVLNPNLKFDPSYTGQIYDIDTGLYYYKARYYNPQLGRFIQPDTVVPDAKNYQAHNRYSYVMNNPMKYTDPSGHGFWSWFRKLFGAFIGALISVITFGLLSPVGFTLAALSLGEALLFGAVSGLAGGVIGGAISGGLRGALMGGLFGFIGGALFAGVGHGIASALTPAFGAGAGAAAQQSASNAAAGILAGVGLGLSYATGGWQGVVTFGVGVLGAFAGGGILKISGIAGKFSDQHDVAKDISNKINPQSISENREYAGMIYRNKDGTYSYTQPNAGTTDGSNPGGINSVPSETEATAYYHTHGGYDPAYKNEVFSPADINYANSNNIDGYLATPFGKLLYYNHNTGEKIQIGIVKTK